MVYKDCIMSNQQDHNLDEKRHALARRFILFAAAVRQATSGEALSRMLGVKVTDSQADALRFLILNNHASMGEIAMGLGHTISGATKAMNRLERQGWVTRTHGGEDQRTVYVHLTDKGKKLAESLLAETETRMNRILWKLRPDTLDRFGRVLEEFLRDFIDDENVADKLCSACGFEGGIHCRESDIDCVVAKKVRSLEQPETYQVDTSIPLKE